MDKEFIGVDVSKDTLDAVAYNSNKQWHFPNNEAGISRSVQVIGELAPALVVMESTGGYETPHLLTPLTKRESPALWLIPGK